MQTDIIGSGIVSCLGSNIEEVWAAMLAGKTGFRSIERFPAEDFPQQKGGMLPPQVEEALRNEFDEDDIAYGMIIAAARQALGDRDGDDAGLILGTNFGLMETREWCWRERVDTDELDPDTFERQLTVTQQVASELGLNGPCAQLSLSCASGASALALGWQWLQAQRCSRVLVVCYDAITEYCWCGLSNLRTITTDIVRPFNKERTGTLFSEGAAAVLISRVESDNNSRIGKLLGGATNNNAYHMTAPCKEAEGSRRVMAEALRASGVSADQLDFISAHATGTAANDVTESAAINNLLNKRRPPVAAFKANIGHMMGAAGMAEIVIALQALKNGVLPPVVNLVEQDPECDVDVVKDEPRSGDFKLAITNSAGLGGNNGSTVLARADADTPEPQLLDRDVYCANLAWVLPGTAGAGTSLPELGNLQGRNGELEKFPVKDYIQTVKGYLDPNSGFSLAAAALSIRERALPNPERIAVITATQYGAATSGYRFFEQMVAKGHRFASPMIFPHSYSNTAGNLVAIEFGLSGPHLVFDLATDAVEAAWVAVDLVRRGLADDALLIVNEGAPPATIPDGVDVLHGAVCLQLTAASGNAVPSFSPQPDNRGGAVNAILKDLLP